MTDPARMPEGPVYLPSQRVACTPLGDRLRVAGMMEFRRPEAPLDDCRVLAIGDAARPFLQGADLDDRQDEWVGSRPCTTDGLPLIGTTRSPVATACGASPSGPPPAGCSPSRSSPARRPRSWRPSR